MSETPKTKEVGSLTPEEQAHKVRGDNATRVELEIINAMAIWEQDGVGADSIVAALLSVGEQLILANNLPPALAEQVRKASRRTAQDRIEAQRLIESEIAENDRQKN